MGQGVSFSSSVLICSPSDPRIICASPTPAKQLHRDVGDEGEGERQAKGEGMPEDLTLDLPDECLSTVMAKLSCRDRNSCSLVCRRWNLIDSKGRQRLVLAAHSELTQFLPTMLSRFDAVSALSLKCSRRCISIDDAAFFLIARCLKSLSKLKLKGCVGITDDGLVASACLLGHSLRKFSCSSCSFTARGLGSLLSRCGCLQELTLKRLRKLDAQSNDTQQQKLIVDDIGEYSDSKPLSLLERLCLKDLHNASLLSPLISSKSLKTLIICRSAGMWNAAFQRLGRSSLVEIRLENLHLSDAGLRAISTACLDLEMISISRASHCTDAGLSSIAASCKKLRKLHIDASARFSIRQVGDNGVISIASGCCLLQEVVLMGVPLTALSLHALASNCPFIERMALCDINSIGDAELAFVAIKFIALRKLCIKNCPITDTGMEAIAAGCPSLVKLKLKRCREVTLANVCRLRQLRESLVILIDVDALAIGEEEEMTSQEQVFPSIAPSGDLGNQRARRLRTPSSWTHLVCGSGGANLIKSKLGTIMMVRRPNIHTPSVP